MSDERKPDAVKAPIGFANGNSAVERLLDLKAKLAPTMGVSSIAVFNQGPFYYVATDNKQTLLFNAFGPRAGQDRYTWEDQGGGVSYGYLVEGANA